MKKVPVLIFIFTLIAYSSSVIYAQNCPKSSDFQVVEIINSCDDKTNGEIHLEFESKIEGIEFGLYDIESKIMVINRINNQGKEVGIDYINFIKVKSGQYKIAIYNSKCPDYPIPTLLPNEGIVVKNETCN